MREAAADTAGAGHDVAWEIHALAARAHARTGDLESAAAAGRSAIDAVERVRGQFASGLLRTSYLAERETVYRELVTVLLRLGRTEEALEVADAVRGRALLEHLAALRANGGATVRELAEEERQILRQADDLARRIDDIEATAQAETAAEYRAELGRLHRQLDRTQARYAIALLRAEERMAGRIGIVGGAKASMAEVKRALGADEALLEYLVEPESVRVFVVTREAVASSQAEIPRPSLSMRVRLARELVGRPGIDREAAGPVLAALHDLLVAPAARSGLLAGKRRIVVVPHAELTYVPFAALRDPATGRYLVEDFAILHLPSAAALPALRQSRGKGHSPAGAIGFAPFPEELRHSVGEVGALRESLGGSRSVKGSEATERRFRRALAEAAVVHAATHGVLNARNPLFSRLAFVRGRGTESKDDGRLEVHELVSSPVRAGLVFLSGCETGVGSAWATGFGRGEDYATLERAFLYAGAGNVIATLWRVEDEKAAVFAKSFYRHLTGSRSEHSVSDALANAQREMLGDPRFGSPYHWAGYRVSGSGDVDPRTIRGSRSWRDRLLSPFWGVAAQAWPGLSVPNG